jgi:hypothetical protein
MQPKQSKQAAKEHDFSLSREENGTKLTNDRYVADNFFVVVKVCPHKTCNVISQVRSRR